MTQTDRYAYTLTIITTVIVIIFSQGDMQPVLASIVTLAVTTLKHFLLLSLVTPTPPNTTDSSPIMPVFPVS